jgi:uncharacterized protein involved in exopolysaccharide biosynthesis
MTSHQEKAQTRAQAQAPKRNHLPRWAFTLIGSGLLALLAGWAYLLVRGLGYLWRLVFY